MRYRPSVFMSRNQWTNLFESIRCNLKIVMAKIRFVWDLLTVQTNYSTPDLIFVVLLKTACIIDINRCRYLFKLYLQHLTEIYTNVCIVNYF